MDRKETTGGRGLGSLGGGGTGVTAHGVEVSLWGDKSGLKLAANVLKTTDVCAFTG